MEFYHHSNSVLLSPIKPHVSYMFDSLTCSSFCATTSCVLGCFQPAHIRMADRSTLKPFVRWVRCIITWFVHRPGRQPKILVLPHPSLISILLRRRTPIIAPHTEYAWLWLKASSFRFSGCFRSLLILHDLNELHYLTLQYSSLYLPLKATCFPII